MSSEAGQAQVTYFYCSFGDSKSLEAHRILASILAQLCKLSNPTYEKVEAWYDQKLKTTSAPLSKLDTYKLVEFIIEQTLHRKTFIFIDGINECDDPFDVLKHLETIARSSSLIRIFLSSINEKGIDTYIQKMPNPYTLTLEHKDINSDVRLLVQASLDSHPRLCHHTPALKAEVTFALTEGAQGM